MWPRGPFAPPEIKLDYIFRNISFAGPFPLQDGWTVSFITTTGQQRITVDIHDERNASH